MRRTHISTTKGLFCLFVCFISAITIYGKDNDFQLKKDSLLKIIASTQGEEKLEAYKILTNSSRFSQFSEEEIDLMLQYINDFIGEARKQQNKEYELTAYQNEIAYLWNYLRFDEFEKKANKYLPIFKKHGKKKPYYVYYKNVLLLQFAGNKISHNHAIENAKQMYMEAKQENNLFGIIQACAFLSQLYLDTERHKDAEEYSRETLKYALNLIKKEPDFTNYSLVSDGYNNLSTALFSQKKTNELLSVMSDWKKHTADFKKRFDENDPLLVQYFKYCAYISLDNGKCQEAELYCDSMESISIPIEDQYVWQIKASICENRNELENAIYWIDKHIEQISIIGELNSVIRLQKEKSRILSKMGRTEELYSVLSRVIYLNDSLRFAENNAQLDEIRTQYEVDKYIAEKERNLNYLVFAVNGCILLAIALGIWVYLHRKITRKNRLLVHQIKELTAQQEERINEILSKTSFVSHYPNETISVAGNLETVNDLCVESRMDKLCIAVRELLLKDKIYRNPAITQETVIESLGTNRRVFSEAMDYCLKMQFKDYVNLLRLKDAVQLLEQSDLPIEEISDKVGFGTVRTFQNQFSTKYNISPRDFRNTMKTTTVSVSKS